MIDDYDVPSAAGCSIACNEFLFAHPELKLEKLDDQFYFIKP
jgi:hypothetical protein